MSQSQSQSQYPPALTHPGRSSEQPLTSTFSEARQMFDQYAVSYNFGYAAHRQSIPQFLTAAKIQAHEDVLDLGCGVGYVALEAAAQARTVVGLDASEECLQRARNSAQQRGNMTNISFAQADITNQQQLRTGLSRARTGLPDIPADNRFHVITLCWVMQLWSETTQRAFLTMVQSFLAPGGRIVLSYDSSVKAGHIIDITYAQVNPVTGIFRNIQLIKPGHYVGRRKELDIARKEVRDLISSIGFQSQGIAAFPQWASLGYRDSSNDILQRARFLSKDKNPNSVPDWQWLENARDEFKTELERQCRASTEYGAAEQGLQAGEQMVLLVLSRIPTVVGVFKVQPTVT